jgi:hypothetical protein
MNRALVTILLLLLLGTTALQTFRVNYWKHMVDTKAAECNRAIALNENSFKNSSTEERVIWLQIRDHLWQAYTLQGQRVDNHRSIISTPREIQLLTGIQSEIQTARDQTQSLLNEKYAVTHLHR